MTVQRYELWSNGWIMAECDRSDGDGLAAGSHEAMVAARRLLFSESVVKSQFTDSDIIVTNCTVEYGDSVVVETVQPITLDEVLASGSQ